MLVLIDSGHGSGGGNERYVRAGIGWSIQERGVATISRRVRGGNGGTVPAVKSDGEENRFAASYNQGMFVMSCQRVVRSANSPTIAIESNAARLGGDDRLDADDETLSKNVVTVGIGKRGNVRAFVKCAAAASVSER